MRVLVTGASGFIGGNLCAFLETCEGIEVLRHDVGVSSSDLDAMLGVADIVFHLAGVNRPEDEEEFRHVNVGLTQTICGILHQTDRHVPIVLASSIQAHLDNPYGISKRQAEACVRNYAEELGGRAVIYRLANVFGKWCRPHYNSVVATFCHCIARGEPIHVSDPERRLRLVHIDDVILQWKTELGNEGSRKGLIYREVGPQYEKTLAELAGLIYSFREMRQTVRLPDLGDDFLRKLYGTYVSYLAEEDFAYDMDVKYDSRGGLAEFVKSPGSGQIFVSRTKPGITRGNHFHHTKTEKFLVVQGEAVIRFRSIRGGMVLEYRVSGDEFKVVDIPPGYTHSIENIGAGELVTLFWASESYDPEMPDTYALPVLADAGTKERMHESLDHNRNKA